MKKRNDNKKNQNSDFSLAHVLYQKLGNDWYAFTEVDGDCFMSKVEEDVAHAQLAAEASEITKKYNRAA